jgi:hypothetical protein
MQAMWSRFSLRRVFKDMTSIISLSLTLLQAATVASSLRVYITYLPFVHSVLLGSQDKSCLALLSSGS